MPANMTRQEAFNESDLLEGEINRMFVSDDEKEILRMYRFACKRLERIYLYNLDRIDRAETFQQPEVSCRNK